MKEFIYKSNQYILERYPNIWNTRIIWVLFATFLINILYFIFGYFAYSNPESLQNSYIINDYYQSGSGLFGVIISILLIVIWIVFLFKNNAFKSYYPTTKLNLLTQFFLFFIIFFVSITFYFSYSLGVKAYISTEYPDERMNKEIYIINQTAPFFSHDVENYFLSNRIYPPPFDSLYCETNADLINTYKSFITFWNRSYQFFSIQKQKRPLKDSLFNDNQLYKEKSKDGKYYIFYFKKDVVDVSKYCKGQELSYYNYSNIFYNYDKENEYRSYDYSDNILPFKSKSSTKTYNLLKNKDPQAFKKLFNEYFKVNNYYKIKTNLNPDILFSLVYFPDNYPLKNIIATTKNSVNEHSYDAIYSGDSISTIEENIDISTNENIDSNGNIKKSHSEIFYENHTTAYYLETENLKNVLNNIDEVKNSPIFNSKILIYVFVAFFFALLVFIFRVTGLKPLIFSIITTGVLGLIIALFTLLFIYSNQDSIELIPMFITLILGAIIIIIPIFFLKSVSKLISSICINLTLVGIIPYILLIIGIISYFQENRCRELYSDYTHREENCFVLFGEINPVYLSIGLLIFGFIFIYFYSEIIKKWKALPEN